MLILLQVMLTNCTKMDVDFNPWTTIMKVITNDRK